MTAYEEYMKTGMNTEVKRNGFSPMHLSYIFYYADLV